MTAMAVRFRWWINIISSAHAVLGWRSEQWRILSRSCYPWHILYHLPILLIHWPQIHTHHAHIIIQINKWLWTERRSRKAIMVSFIYRRVWLRSNAREALWITAIWLICSAMLWILALNMPIISHVFFPMPRGVSWIAFRIIILGTWTYQSDERKLSGQPLKGYSSSYTAPLCVLLRT